MSPIWTFFTGLFLLITFAWYFLTDSDRIKRILGSFLTVALVGLCLVEVYPPDKKIPLGLDLKGGTSFLIELVETDIPEGTEGAVAGQKREITKTMVDQAVEVIRKRVDKSGTGEPVITPSGTNRILVQIPGLSPEKLSETREQLRKVAKLDFCMVHPQSEQILAGLQPPDPAYRVVTHHSERVKGKPVDEQLVIRKKADIPGSMIVGAHAFIEGSQWGVSLKFSSEGAEIFGKLTSENVGQRFAIVLDGQIQSAPVIQTAIYGGTAQITGSFSQAEAMGLASVLENPLQNEVKIREERSTSATLGADAINSGIKAGVMSVLLTFVCVLLYYRFAGLVANIALVVNIVLLFGAMAMFGIVLTLPGIAGVILTVGMAIDANVLIYERLREELASGKSNNAAVSAAFKKAFSAIFDSNVTTLITALILFWKATGPIKGFAVTLTIGIIASLFTALVVTRNLFEWALHTGFLKQIRMGSLIDGTNFDFLGKRRLAVTFSLIVIIGSIGLVAVRGDRNLGVDFKGGDRLVMEAKGTRPTDNEVRAVIDGMTPKVGDFIVQTETSAQKIFTTIRSPQGTHDAIETALREKLPNAQFDVGQFETVGGLVGDELKRNSMIALVLGMVGILIYVTVQFEFSYALGALVALLHDVIITIGAFALFDREMSLIIVGAVLTIAGYSVNDTVVVFDRIREGIRDGRKGSVLEIMNLSINETLSRTILTGGVTLISTVVLYIFGGPVLNDFAFAILVGVLVGTYSSIFVAAPVVYWWSNLGNKNQRSASNEETVVA